MFKLYTQSSVFYSRNAVYVCWSLFLEIYFAQIEKCVLHKLSLKLRCAGGGRWGADRGDMSTRAMWATSGQLSAGQQTTLSGWHVNLDDGRPTFKRIPHTSSQHNLGLMPQIIIKGNGISHELIVFGKVSMMASEDFKTKRRLPVAFLWSVPKGNMCWNSFEQILIFGRLRLE